LFVFQRWSSRKGSHKHLKVPRGNINGDLENPTKVEPPLSRPLLGSNTIPDDALHRLSSTRRFSIKSTNDDWAIIADDEDPQKSADEIMEINQLKKKRELRVMNVLSIISGLVFILWIVTVSLTKVFLGWTTLLASLTIMLAHAVAVYIFGDAKDWSPDKDIFRSGHIIDFGLLFLFQGMFILVGSLLHTGWPEEIFNMLLGSTGDAIVELWLVLILLYSILAASNILSNVPVIMLLEPLIIQLSDPLLGWMIVAWASTIAGNLTLVGSAANLIVAE